MNKKRRQQNNRGLTLVEMLVSFTLLSMFMVAATMMIASTMNVYYEAKGNSYGLQVSGIILGKISGELEGAINGTIVSEDFTDEGGDGISGAMLIGKDRIEFTNASGSHVNLGLTETDGKKYLALHYYEVPLEDGEGNLYEAVDWTFASAAYMGYSVKELTFSRPQGDYAYNVIKIDMTLTSPKYGDYSVTDYVECYNFDENMNPSYVVDVADGL